MKTFHRVLAAAWIVAAAWTACPTPAGADKVILTDGQVYEGVVVERGGNYEVSVGTAIYSIPRELVRRVERSEGAAAPAPGAPAPAAAPVATPSPATPPPAPNPAPSLERAQWVSSTAPPAELIKQAQDAVARKAYPYARNCLTMVIKFHPDSPEVARARAMLRDVPAEDGRLILGFDSPEEARAIIQGRGNNGFTNAVTWISDPKVVPDGKGAVHVVLKGPGAAARFPIPSQTFATLQTFSFWIWAEARIVGMTGTTYFCLYTDDPGDYLMASFQLRGDCEWRRIVIDAGRFNPTKKTTGRRFTSAGFWNPSPELREFIIDEVRANEGEVAPHTGKHVW
jgi:hypothetical protein